MSQRGINTCAATKKSERPLTSIERQLLEIIMRLSDVLEANNSLIGILNKVEIEIVGRIVTLQATIDEMVANMEDATLTPEQEASVVAVREAVARLDDIVPDVTPTPPDEVPGIPA